MIGSLCTLLVGLLVPVQLHAQIDLTGMWDITVIDTIHIDIVQTGTVLTINEYSGTMDPITGVFALESPPQPGGVIAGIPYDSSPPGTLNGVATADGNSFTATVTSWHLSVGNFPWGELTFPVRAARRRALFLTLHAARADTRGRFRARGVLSADLASPTDGIVRIGATEYAFTIGTCRGQATRLRCRSTDGLVRTYMSRQTPTDDWRLRLSITGIATPAPPTEPLGLEIVDRASGRQVGAEAVRCITLPSAVACKP